MSYNWISHSICQCLPEHHHLPTLHLKSLLSLLFFLSVVKALSPCYLQGDLTGAGSMGKKAPSDICKVISKLRSNITGFEKTLALLRAKQLLQCYLKNSLSTFCWIIGFIRASRCRSQAEPKTLEQAMVLQHVKSCQTALLILV